MRDSANREHLMLKRDLQGWVLLGFWVPYPQCPVVAARDYDRTAIALAN